VRVAFEVWRVKCGGSKIGEKVYALATKVSKEMLIV